MCTTKCANNAEVVMSCPTFLTLSMPGNGGAVGGASALERGDFWMGSKLAFHISSMNVNELLNLLELKLPSV